MLTATTLLLAGCATAGADVTIGSSAAATVPTSSPTATTVAAGDDVPVARPTHLSFPAAGIDGPVDEYTAADAQAEGGINPSTLDTISWYSGIADALPGTAATNTVYLFGHSWVQPAVFNGLADVVVGDRATVTTANGILTYAVDEVITMAKADFTSDPRVIAVVPGRLALVTCRRPDGWDPSAAAPDNRVVFLHLVDAQAQR
ncbi:class F sortase [Microbacterium pumilum]|uniref:Class F sortase n=1 Tax=Microbacterium pumilum TaxID=344165 RepID=A0ABN2S9Y3_9MICO